MNCTIKQLKLVIDINDPWFFNNVLGSVPFLEHYLCDEEKCEIKKLNEEIEKVKSKDYNIKKEEDINKIVVPNQNI